MQKINTLVLLCAMGVLTACTHTQQVDPTNLNQLENMSEQSTDLSTEGDSNQLRSKALEDTAMSVGAQGGLASASDMINKRLKQDEKYLDSLYNFNGMMLSHGVLPPVLVEGNFTLNLADSTTIRVSDKTYTIVEQARFATTPPTWREYLWMAYEKPELPRKFLLPRNKEEQKMWAAAIRKGWDLGLQQAYNIFHQNLARLKRDYNGMILYRKLLQENMVSPPFVSRTELGVTGDGNGMSINDQVLRITELPKLQTDSDRWKAIVVKKDDN